MSLSWEVGVVQTPASDDAIRSRVGKCKGMTTQQIAEEFAGDGLEQVTRELLVMCLERGDEGILPEIPLRVRHTMYGEDDIADWVLGYEPGARTIDEADEDAEVDAHVRWERWEDCVRLLNGDVNGMSLFYALRAIALGEDEFRSKGRWWFMGTNFTADPSSERPGRLIGYLRGKVWQPADELDAFVEEIGLEKLLRARALTIAETMRDLRASEMLVGSWLRWEIAGFDSIAHADFEDATRVTVKSLTREEAAATDPTGGVTTLFTTKEAFLMTAGGRAELGGLLVEGKARLVGTDERIATFNAAQRRMYRPGAMD